MGIEHVWMDKADAKMEKTINVLKETLSTLRAGRANPHVLDKITVSYYGTPTPINQVGNIAVPEPRVLTISPWDASILKDVEKAIMASDLGINPSNDGKIIRLVFPEPTAERRQELVKKAKKMGEEAKIAIRSVRRDAIEHFKKDKKDSVITEDDLKDLEKEIQDKTDKFSKDIDKTISDKEKEIMEI